MQTFLVSRIFRWIGVGGALLIMPAISLTGYSLLAFAPVLALIRGAKILENSADYSLNNTVRHALFLPTSRRGQVQSEGRDRHLLRARRRRGLGRLRLRGNSLALADHLRHGDAQRRAGGHLVRAGGPDSPPP